MIKKLFVAAAILAGSFTVPSHAFDLNSILGNVGTAASGLVDGLLTQSDITVEQMAGTWTATGSAVCFQSENFLKKAGGAAAASTIENKLNPYYQQYGLTGSVLTIDNDGSFTLKIKSVTLKGKVTKRSDGNFDFAFTALGSVKLGTVKAYVEKPVSGLNVMFDASKLKSLLTTVIKLTGNSLAKTAGDLLGSYNGLCVGFAFSGTGTGTTNNGTNNTVKQATDVLKGLFGK